MLILVLLAAGLVLGSFINALVWRIHEQDKQGKRKKPEKLSILKGRSMCVNCGHELAAKDLVPVFSWLWLKGKCRYCHKSISWQYPLVELVTALLFLVSYIYWPFVWDTVGTVNFIAWLVILTGFMALIVYDFRWMLLPNRIIYPLIVLASALALYNLVATPETTSLAKLALSVLIAGGLFWGLFELSKGKWIGGGDVKLGLLLGFVLTDPYKAFLTILIASLLGTLLVVPGLLLKKITPKSHIPFGPFLIVAAIIAYLFGASIIDWYESSLLITV